MLSAAFDLGDATIVAALSDFFRAPGRRRGEGFGRVHVKGRMADKGMIVVQFVVTRTGYNLLDQVRGLGSKVRGLVDWIHSARYSGNKINTCMATFSPISLDFLKLKEKADTTQYMSTTSAKGTSISRRMQFMQALLGLYRYTSGTPQRYMSLLRYLYLMHQPTSSAELEE